MPDWYIATAIGFAALAIGLYGVFVLYDRRLRRRRRSTRNGSSVEQP